MDTPQDLAWYARALRDRWARIPAGALSAMPMAVELPRYPPPQLVVEPYIETDRCALPLHLHRCLTPAVRSRNA